MMKNAIRITIGVDAECSDGVCGEVSGVVVDPIARAVTHLLVEPKHRRGLGRLVPVDLVDSAGREVRLRCTRAEFDELEPGEETHALPGNNADADYGPGHAISWPYHSLGIAGAVADFGAELFTETVTNDKIPVGEVAIRRGERVDATDGHLGRVRGLVIDLADHHLTHILLASGHLIGRKQVAVPISAVDAIDHDDIRLEITRHEAVMPSGIPG